MKQDDDNTLKRENLGLRFARSFVGAVDTMDWNYILPAHLNVIALPKAQDGKTYKAYRNARRKWNVVAEYPAGGGLKALTTKRDVLATGLSLEDALDMLAEKNPEGLQKKTKAYNHPVKVAAVIEHDLRKPEAPRQPPKKTSGFNL